jgi:hypothetical protein
LQDDNDYDPVWRLILKRHLGHKDVRVAWAAEQALAE